MKATFSIFSFRPRGGGGVADFKKATHLQIQILIDTSSLRKVKTQS